MAKRTVITAGEVFNNLIVLEEVHSQSARKFKLQCICGNITEVFLNNLVRGHTKSCGCLAAKTYGDSSRTHGMTKTGEYKSWQEMKSRCYNAKHLWFDYYGGRGISVYKPWIDNFKEFLNYIGYKPDGGKWSIERLDVDGNYEPGNVVWASTSQQNRNRRKFRNNTTGYTGVTRRERNGIVRFIAIWIDLDGNEKSKSFSEKKYGSKAFDLAVEYRKAAISKINSEGAGYTEKHGV